MVLGKHVHAGLGRRRVAAAVALPVAIIVGAALILRKHGNEVGTTLSQMPLSLIVCALVTQLVIIVSRFEAWKLCLQSAGAPLPRRLIYGAGALGLPCSVLNVQLGTAVRIAALRRIAPGRVPELAPMIACELPVLGAEMCFGALLVLLASDSLGLPLWLPGAAIVLSIALILMARRAESRFKASFLRGFHVLAESDSRAKLIGLVGVFMSAQLTRIWILLCAAGLAATPLDASAVMVGNGVLAQLPIGPAAGTGASALVFGEQMHLAAAAGMAMTGIDLAVGLALLVAAGALIGRLLLTKPALAEIAA